MDPQRASKDLHRLRSRVVELEAKLKTAVEEEREACAKIASDNAVVNFKYGNMAIGFAHQATANAIRERGRK